MINLFSPEQTDKLINILHLYIVESTAQNFQIHHSPMNDFVVHFYTSTYLFYFFNLRYTFQSTQNNLFSYPNPILGYQPEYFQLFFYFNKYIPNPTEKA